MDERAQNDTATTMFLHNWRQGDAEALDKVTEYVYSELRRRASAYPRNERRGHTLQTTGLVHDPKRLVSLTFSGIND